MDIEQFFTKIAYSKEEMNKFLNGEKGPLKDINDGLERIDKKLKEINTISNKKRDEYDYLNNPTQREDMMNAACFGLEFVMMQRMMNPTKEKTEDEIKRLSELEKELINYNDELHVVLNNRKILEDKKNGIIEDYKKLEKLYFYSYIFDIDMKNAGSIEKFSDLLCKFDTELNDLIDSKVEKLEDSVNEKIDDISNRHEKAIDAIVDRVTEIETDINSKKE